MKSKGLAIVLALLLGWLGIHKFYLGQPVWGLVYIMLTIGSVIFLMYGVGVLGFIVLAGLIALDIGRLAGMRINRFHQLYG